MLVAIVLLSGMVVLFIFEAGDGSFAMHLLPENASSPTKMERASDGVLMVRLGIALSASLAVAAILIIDRHRTRMPGVAAVLILGLLCALFVILAWRDVAMIHYENSGIHS